MTGAEECHVRAHAHRPPGEICFRRFHKRRGFFNFICACDKKPFLLIYDILCDIVKVSAALEELGHFDSYDCIIFFKWKFSCCVIH